MRSELMKIVPQQLPTELSDDGFVAKVEALSAKISKLADQIEVLADDPTMDIAKLSAKELQGIRLAKQDARLTAWRLAIKTLPTIGRQLSGLADYATDVLLISLATRIEDAERECRFGLEVAGIASTDALAMPVRGVERTSIQQRHDATVRHAPSVASVVALRPMLSDRIGIFRRQANDTEKLRQQCVDQLNAFVATLTEA